MPALADKKQRTHISSASRTIISTMMRTSFSLTSLPSEVLARVLSEREVISVIKVFKPKKVKGYKVQEDEYRVGLSALRHVRELSVSVENPYSTSPSRSTLISSLISLLHLTHSLTALTLSVGDTFRLLPSAEIWLHDLSPLLSSWPRLRTLDIACLRGDCNHRLDPHSACPEKPIKLVVRESSLTEEMVAWLLEGQTGLKWLKMPLPGSEEGNRAWKAVEKVAEEVEVLKVWDGWAVHGGTSKSGKKTATMAAKEDKDSDEEDDTSSDIFQCPPSPLLALVVKATTLRTLLLTAPLLPSAPSAESFFLLLPHLTNLETLCIEDTPASGLRAAVQEALEAGKDLEKLEKVVSIGLKRRKGGKKAVQVCEEGEVQNKLKKGKKEKAFQKACEKRGINWIIETV
ncbi:hypothetical protein JCM11251_003977 [Rhodosporidiobolus azoricus]